LNPSNATAAALLVSCPLPRLDPSQKIVTCLRAATATDYS
jgi:hypothetical protein